MVRDSTQSFSQTPNHTSSQEEIKGPALGRETAYLKVELCCPFEEFCSLSTTQNRAKP